MRKNGDKKKGRPAGSKNKVYDVTRSRPPRCKCGSTRIVAVPGAKPVEKAIPGKDHDGQPYDGLRWQRSRCEACGQHVNVITPYCEGNNPETILTS